MKEEKKDKREKKDSGENLILSGVAGSSYDTINKYGSAAKEHLVALYGHDRENHVELKKSLKSVQNQKSNPENLILNPPRASAASMRCKCQYSNASAPRVISSMHPIGRASSTLTPSLRSST